MRWVFFCLRISRQLTGVRRENSFSRSPREGIRISCPALFCFFSFYARVHRSGMRPPWNLRRWRRFLDRPRPFLPNVPAACLSVLLPLYLPAGRRVADYLSFREWEPCWTSSPGKQVWKSSCWQSAARVLLSWFSRLKRGTRTDSRRLSKRATQVGIAESGRFAGYK